MSRFDDFTQAELLAILDCMHDVIEAESDVPQGILDIIKVLYIEGQEAIIP